MNNQANKSESPLMINGLNPLTQQVVTDETRLSITIPPRFLRNGVSLNVNIESESGDTLWERKDSSACGAQLYCENLKLSPKSLYTVRLDGVDADGEGFCIRAPFETGFMGQPWQAKWIEPRQEHAEREKEITFHEIFGPQPDDNSIFTRLKPCPELKKTFTCGTLPQKARLYASAHGLYELRLNGKPVGSRLLSPETSAYNKRLYYQTYDVLAGLCEGENELIVTLADGWWAGRIGLSGDSCQYGDTLGFIMQLDMWQADTVTDSVLTDASFFGRRSNIDYADLYVGERQDFSRNPGKWEPVNIAEYTTNNLVAQPIAPVISWCSLSPERFIQTPKQELVADFGQVLAGVVEIIVDCEKGTEITLDFCEVLDERGNYFRNIIGRNKEQRDSFVCGDGATIFRPRFTYHGFRYVRITGAEHARIQSVKALAIGTELYQRGSFSCSDERINQLQSNIVWSMRGNMLSVPTDCPQREKMGWTGDIQVFLKTAAFNFDVLGFLTGWLDNMRCEQGEDGEIPMVVPCFPAQDKMQRELGGDNTSPAWGDAAILAPLYLYQCYGDISVLRDNFAMMERWLEFIKKAAARKPENYESLTTAQKERNQYLWTKGHQFGDWLIPSFMDVKPIGPFAGVEATYEVIGSCFYAITVRAFLEVLQALDGAGYSDASLKQKIVYYTDLLARIKTAVEQEYISEGGMIKRDLQGLYVIALYAGIGDAKLQAKMAAQLARVIRENGYKLDTGFVATPYLLDVLVETGYRDIAYKLLFQTECPSWLYQIEKGATTIWENWAAIKPDGTVTNSSFNHYAFGCVGDWLYRRVAGICPTAAGYRSIRFAPLFDVPLTSARASFASVYGTIHTSWTKKSDSVSCEITVPESVSAVVVLPVLDANAIKEGGLPLKDRFPTARTGNEVEISIEGDSYHFEFICQKGDLTYA